MPLNLDAVGKKIGPMTSQYTWKEAVLYALGVGAGFDELEYVYENRLKIIPSFAVPLAYPFFAEVVARSGINLAGLLHAEQETVFHAPLSPEGDTLTTEGRITRVYDRGEGRGAFVIAEAETFGSDGRRRFTNIMTLFGRLDGGFGGEPPPKEEFAFPDRPPDFVEEQRPSPDQPLIYRLSGDTFALHVDPISPAPAALRGRLCTASAPTASPAAPSSNTSSPANRSACPASASASTVPSIRASPFGPKSGNWRRDGPSSGR
jgi:acyl dehydratase